MRMYDPFGLTGCAGRIHQERMLVGGEFRDLSLVLQQVRVNDFEAIWRDLCNGLGLAVMDKRKSRTTVI